MWGRPYRIPGSSPGATEKIHYIFTLTHWEYLLYYTIYLLDNI